MCSQTIHYTFYSDVLLDNITLYGIIIIIAIASVIDIHAYMWIYMYVEMWIPPIAVNSHFHASHVYNLYRLNNTIYFTYYWY